MSTPRLASRIAVVTGSSSGNGREIALALAAEGAHVVCADVTELPREGGYDDDPTVPTHELLTRKFHKSIFVKTDVTDEAQMIALGTAAVEEFGRIDVWVNNAGIGIGLGPLESCSVDDLNLALQINLVGTWLGCKVAKSHMMNQSVVGPSRGQIINLGSVSADGGQADLSIYSVTKGGVHALTRSLAIECAPLGIGVNAVAPGYIPTAMTRPFWEDPHGAAHIKEFQPWFEMAQASDVAGPVVFLASDESGFVTGMVLRVDGGALAG